MKIIKKIFFGILGFIIGFCLIVLINGNCILSYNSKEKLNDWMKYIDDNVKVSEIVIPGSHDAGSSGMLWLGETQHLTIKEQLESGARYFDIRVYKKEDDLIIYHDIINGTKFIPILEDIKEFIENNPTETLLLDFQHFKGNSQSDVFNLITEYLYNNGLLIENNTSLSDLEFITNLTLKDARGKCIIFWGDRSNDNSNYLFFRNNDDCTNSDMSLNSYYLGDFHKSKVEDLFEFAYPIYFANIQTKIEEEQKGIFVLQAQLTDGALIFGPWSRERNNNKKITSFINSLKDDSRLEYVNVIMRDFITYDKCLDIINLNYYKENSTHLYE